MTKVDTERTSHSPSRSHARPSRVVTGGLSHTPRTVRVHRAFVGTLLAGVLFGTGVAAQSAEAEVAERVMSFYQALNDGDARTWATHNNAAQYHGNFPRQGTLFGNDLPVIENMQQGFDSGSVSYNLVVHHIDVSAYGNTAVATFYTTGPTTLQNGTVITGTFRVTQVWLREGRSWGLVHFHISPLAS